MSHTLAVRFAHLRGDQGGIMDSKLKSDIAQKCASLKMEPVIFESNSGAEKEKVIFYSATPPKESDKETVIQVLPSDVEYDFRVDLKPSTIYAIQIFISSVNGTICPRFSFKDALKIYLPAESNLRPIDEIVDGINEVLLLDEFFGQWTIFVGEEERKFTLAGLRAMRTFKVQKHDFRDKAIGADDITNLRIALETMDVTSFISSI